MDIPLNVEVHCSDGLAGYSNCIILNPVTKTITHFVLHRHAMLGEEVLVPIRMIKESTPDLILLNCSLEKLAGLDSFLRGHFLGLNDESNDWLDQQVSKYAQIKTMAWPYHAYGDPYGIYVTEEQIPLDECPIHRGSQVEAADGWVGKVSEFLVQPKNNSITHLVLRENHFWGDKSVTIPVSQIVGFEKDNVKLKLKREEVKDLPHILMH